MKILDLLTPLHKLTQFLIYVASVIIIISFGFIHSNLNELGKLAGEGAIIMMWVVSLPGILKRFQVTGALQQVQIVLMKSRRRLGVLMFLLAIMHVLWVRTFIYIRYAYIPKISEFSTFELLGIAGFSLLFPLFITSNNFSRKLLAGYWQKIHYLIYIAMWVLGFHIFLQEEGEFAIPTFVIGSLQILSWLRVWVGSKNSPDIAQPSQQTTNPTQSAAPLSPTDTLSQSPKS